MKKLIHYRKPRRGDGLIVISDSSSGGGGSKLLAVGGGGGSNYGKRLNKKSNQIEFKNPNNKSGQSFSINNQKGNQTQTQKIEPRGWESEPERETGAMAILRDDGLCMQIPKKQGDFRNQGGGKGGGGSNKIISRHCQYVPSENDLGALSLGINAGPSSNHMAASSFKANFQGNGTTGKKGIGGSSIGSGHLYRKGVGKGGGRRSGRNSGGLDLGLTGTSVSNSGGGGGGGSGSGSLVLSLDSDESSVSQLLLGNDEISSRLLNTIKTSHLEHSSLQEPTSGGSSGGGGSGSRLSYGGSGLIEPPMPPHMKNHRSESDIDGMMSGIIGSNNTTDISLVGSSSKESKELNDVINHLGEDAKKFCEWYRTEEGKDPTAALVLNVISQVK